MMVTSACAAPTTSVPGSVSISCWPAAVMAWIVCADVLSGEQPRINAASDSSRVARRPARSTSPSSGHDVRTAKILPLVARHLHPLAVLELRHFVHLHLVDAHLAVLVGDPEVDVVDLILGTDNAKVSAGKIVSVIVELPDRLVSIDKFQSQLLAGLVILELEHAIVLRTHIGRVLFNSRHHFPAALV